MELLGPRFRGLWKSVVVQDDGSTRTGWSCTFMYRGNYGEVDYQANALDALRKAVEMVNLHD